MLELQRSPNKIIPHFCLTTILLQAASCGRALRDGSDGEQEAEMSTGPGWRDWGGVTELDVWMAAMFVYMDVSENSGTPKSSI